MIKKFIFFICLLGLAVIGIKGLESDLPKEPITDIPVIHDSIKGTLVWIAGTDSINLFWASIKKHDKYKEIFNVTYKMVVDSEGLYTYTVSYMFGGREPIGDLSSCSVEPYPGDRTITVTCGNKEMIAHEVLEDKEFAQVVSGIQFHSIPQIDYNEQGVKVFDDDADVAFGEIKDGKVLVSMAKDWTKECFFQLDSTGNFFNKDVTFSHFDKPEGRIYYFSNTKLRYIQMIDQ